MKTTSIKTMQDYILEQPAILQRLVTEENITSIQDYLSRQKITANHLVMIASGTSYNAAITASHYINLPVDIYYPYEFNMYCDIKNYPKETLFIVVSQGGESIETYTSLTKVKAQYPTLAVTCAAASTIARHAQSCVLFGCDTETVIYRTKGFTSSLITLIIIGRIISKDHSLSLLSQTIPDKCMLQDFITQSIAYFNRHITAMTQTSAIFFISAGKNKIIGYEAALKAIETIRLPAISCELEEFVHGPQNAINDTTQLIIIENADDSNNKAWNLFLALRKLNKPAYFIAAKAHNEFVDYILLRPICEMDEIVTICALQQFCYTLSQRLGVDLTKPGFPELANYIKKIF